MVQVFPFLFSFNILSLRFDVMHAAVQVSSTAIRARCFSPLRQVYSATKPYEPPILSTNKPTKTSILA